VTLERLADGWRNRQVMFDLTPADGAGCCSKHLVEKTSPEVSGRRATLAHDRLIG
jgi:hypothetical protein